MPPWLLSHSPLFVCRLWFKRRRCRATRPASTSDGAPTKGKKGGKLEQLGASDVDFLDPGQTYYTGGFQVLYATQKTLYSFKPGDPDAQPDLAEGDPEISDDKKSVTVTLKKGVKFAPPVNREIQAKDVKYAFERAFTKNVPNQYTTYFNFIEGAPKKPAASCQDISGIVLDPNDPYKITFKLSMAQGPGFAAFLVMPVTTPVPEEYAKKFDEEAPSTYNENVVATGPYMVENDATGKLARLQGRQVDPARPQPELGREQGLPPRVPRRDPACARTRPTPTCPAARCFRARA